MPLEGHWERLNTPIRAEGRRNVRIVGALLAVVVAAAIAVAVAGIAQHPVRVATPKGCIDVQIAGGMGAERYHPCGQQAREACDGRATRHDPASATIVRACRRQGLLPQR